MGQDYTYKKPHTWTHTESWPKSKQSTSRTGRQQTGHWNWNI